MKVLVVAKTHMSNTACVGALDLVSKQNIRLLTANGQNQPKDTEFNVGDIWDIDYLKRNDIYPPHIEDVLVTKQTFLYKQLNLKNFLLNNVDVWYGSPEDIFNGLLSFDYNSSCYIRHQRGLPNQSVGFWSPDKNVELTIVRDQNGRRRHYLYFGDHGGIFAFPYVGYSEAIETIKKDSIIRVSLARWWKPSTGKVEEKRCYCQLSGWYDN